MHSMRVTSLSITCTVLALLLLLLASINERLYTFDIDASGLDSGGGPDGDAQAAAAAAATVQHESTVLSTLRFAKDYSQSLRLSAAAAADSASVADEPEGGSMRSAWGIGLFSFCYDYHVTSFQGNLTVLAFDFGKSCQVIRTSDCSVSFLPLLQAIMAQISAAAGLNGTAVVPDDVVSIVSDVVLVDQCGQYIAARAFVVLAMLAALLGGAAHLLRWRRKMPLMGVVAAMGVLTLFCVIVVALVVSLEQNDSRLTFINTLALVDPGATQGLQFGPAFFLLAAALVLAVLALAAVAFQAVKAAEQRAQMDGAYAGQLQENARNIGLREQAGGMHYRQMQA